MMKINVRWVERGCRSEPGCGSAVFDVLDSMKAEYPPPQPLMVSLIGTESLRMGEAEDDYAMGCYWSGTDHFAVCVAKPAGLPTDAWLHELRVTVAHEYMHFIQDHQDELADYEQSDLDAEAIAQNMVATIEGNGKL